MSLIANLIIDIKNKVYPILNTEITITIKRQYRTKILFPILFVLSIFIFAFVAGFLSSSLSIVKQIFSPLVFASVFGAIILSIGYIKGQGKLEMLSIGDAKLNIIKKLNKEVFKNNKEVEQLALDILTYFSINSLQQFYNIVLKNKLNENYTQEYQVFIMQLNSEVFSSPIKNKFNKIKINGEFLLNQIQWILNASPQDILTKQILSSNIFISETDTIPGIFCKIKDKLSADQIYHIKKRETSKPLCIYSSNPQKYFLQNQIIKLIITDLPNISLTIISKPSSSVPNFLIKNGFVGIRIVNSSSKFFDFLNKHNLTLVGTSANFSNQASPTSIQNLDENFAQNLPVISFDGNSTMQESSIIKIDENKIIIMREGSYFEEIQKWITKLNSTPLEFFEDGVEKKAYIINLQNHEK